MTFGRARQRLALSCPNIPGSAVLAQSAIVGTRAQVDEVIACRRRRLALVIPPPAADLTAFI